MKRRAFLIFTGLGSLGSSLLLLFKSTASTILQKSPNHVKTAQAQDLPVDVVNVQQFGSLVNGISNNPNIITRNTATIQAAIDAVGQKGGGNIYIPNGLYQIAPPDLNNQERSSLIINYDNITLFGDGIGKTILQSRGNYSLIDGNVVRGHGIMIKGTIDPLNPRKNVTIKNIELSGGTNGFTGNRNWPADPNTGDGWDLTHKGIVLDFNTYLDNINIDSVYVHDFRGEVIYGGGSGIGKVTILNTKIHNSNASMLSIEAELTVKDCEFSQTATAWVENASLSPNKNTYFYKCIFKDSTYQGLVETVGNFQTGNKHIIRNCSFHNSPAGICVFGCSGLVIQENKFLDCDSALLTSQENVDIEFINNQVIGETKAVIAVNIVGKLKNVIIRDNVCKSPDNTEKVTCIFYLGELQNIIIEENIFENCRTPEQSGELTNERPFFRNNQYINVERRDLQGTANFWQEPPYVVEPKCEEIVMVNNTYIPVIEVDMSTEYYVDGQEVLITGGAIKAQVKFPQKSNNVKCQHDRYLRGQGEKLILKFKRSERKWYEKYYQYV